MRIAAVGISIPHFDERMADGAEIFVQDSSHNHNRLAGCLRATRSEASEVFLAGAHKRKRRHWRIWISRLLRNQIGRLSRCACFTLPIVEDNRKNTTTLVRLM